MRRPTGGPGGRSVQRSPPGRAGLGAQHASAGPSRRSGSPRGRARAGAVQARAGEPKLAEHRRRPGERTVQVSHDNVGAVGGCRGRDGRPRTARPVPSRRGPYDSRSERLPRSGKRELRVGWASRGDIPGAHAPGNHKAKLSASRGSSAISAETRRAGAPVRRLSRSCGESVYGARARARGWWGAGGCGGEAAGGADQPVEGGWRVRPA